MLCKLEPVNEACSFAKLTCRCECKLTRRLHAIYAGRESRRSEHQLDVSKWTCNWLLLHFGILTTMVSGTTR